MPKASVLGDVTTGHGGFHPTVVVSGSNNTFVNGKKSVRVSDMCASHVKPKSSPHTPIIASGSSNTFINGKKAARIGDTAGCGDILAGGSSNTFIGG